MTDRVSLPPLAELLRSWKDMGAFHYYKKSLAEFRRPIGGAPTQPEHKPAFGAVLGLISKLVALPGFVWLFVRCVFAPKGRAIVFNHTARRRLGQNGARPLYLFPQNFYLDRMTVVEDMPGNFIYPRGALKLDSQDLLRVASLLSLILNLVCGMVYGVADRDIVDFMVKLRLWTQLLTALRPSRVLVLVWYGKEPLIAACKQLGIEVCDLQHGIIYEEHPLYNILDAANVHGSNFLLPDKCLVYGEYWKQHLLRSGWEEGKVRVVGYFADTSPGFCKVEDAPYILYTSQPHSNAAIIRHIRAIEPEVKRRGWKILIAIHPAENGNAYSEVLSEYVQVSGFDAYDLLRNCIAHVSVSSTLLWEAMVFGKPSFVLEYGREAVGLLGDLLGFGYGRPLAEGEFPEPFALPVIPGREFFFCSTIDKTLLNGSA